MATRANVKVIQGDREQNFYHHWDGGPHALGRVLERMLRSKDTWDFDEICAELKSGTVDHNYPFEPCNSPNGDIEYNYNISCDKKTLTFHHLIDNDYEVLL
jgi:hypothetical protein